MTRANLHGNRCVSNPTQRVQEIIQRSRVWYFFALVLTIAMGLASRRFSGVIPISLGKYPGDALWALMAFFGWGGLFPKISTLRSAQCALATSYAVEILKLYQAPWIVMVRHSTLGHLIFGHAFSWQNLIAYTVGVLGGVGIEFFIHRLRALRSKK